MDREYYGHAVAKTVDSNTIGDSAHRVRAHIHIKRLMSLRIYLSYVLDLDVYFAQSCASELSAIDTEKEPALHCGSTQSLHYELIIILDDTCVPRDGCRLYSSAAI